MKIVLRLAPNVFGDLQSHLLPPHNRREEAAFLFVSQHRVSDYVSFDVVETEKLYPQDFDSQFDDYLELSDVARARLIKRAHDLKASLVEIHSHVGDWPAAFSLSDRAGLKETVPHMWWRLNTRPYIAMVVARSGFDALVWLEDPKIPRPLDGIVAGDQLLRPTNNSLNGWQ